MLAWALTSANVITALFMSLGYSESERRGGEGKGETGEEGEVIGKREGYKEDVFFF